MTSDDLQTTSSGPPAVRPAHRAYLELHGDVLVVLWCSVALLVVGQVVGGARVDDCRLRRWAVQVVAVGVNQR